RGVRPIFENSTACRKSMPKDALSPFMGFGWSSAGMPSGVLVGGCLLSVADSFEIFSGFSQFDCF
ncbi:hypothetical protein, partial [Kribbella pittospori]|uniref:hypothetical protein n=1 Tax=Kribbella pittospori TaxID=722689 RepID=UPI001EDE08BA